MSPSSLGQSLMTKCPSMGIRRSKKGGIHVSVPPGPEVGFYLGESMIFNYPGGNWESAWEQILFPDDVQGWYLESWELDGSFGREFQVSGPSGFYSFWQQAAMWTTNGILVLTQADLSADMNAWRLTQGYDPWIYGFGTGNIDKGETYSYRLLGSGGAPTVFKIKPIYYHYPD